MTPYDNQATPNNWASRFRPSTGHYRPEAAYTLFVQFASKALQIAQSKPLYCWYSEAGIIMTHSIYIAAALLIGSDGKTLLVRKRDTTAFMQPGGKIEPGELAVNALARELDEELGIQIDTAQASFLGTFSAAAANEPGFRVDCELFRVNIDEPVRAAAEIEEVVWVDSQTFMQIHLAPLTQNHVIPIYLGL
jgi:8-oxo-dGTP diphosphatase